MAAQTLYDAVKVSQNPMQTLMLRAIVTTDELFAVLPFVPKAGEGFSYPREKALPNFEFLADTHTSINSSAATPDLVTVPKREAAQDLLLRNFADEAVGAQNELSQVRQLFKAAGRTLAAKTISGGFVTSIVVENFAGVYVTALVACSQGLDSTRYGAGLLRYTHTGTFLEFKAPGDNAYGPAVACAANGNYTLYSHNPNKWVTLTLDVSEATADAERVIRFASTTNEFDGLPILMSPGQVRSSTGTNGDELSFSILDELLDAVKVRENMAFVVPSVLKRKVANLYRALGGTQMTTMPNTGTKVLSYNDVPILINDNIPVTEAKGTHSDLSSVYLAALVPDEGLFMGAAGGASQNVEGDPRVVTVMGFRLLDLGQIQGGPSAHGKRLIWFGALALGSDLAAARAKEIKTLTP